MIETDRRILRPYALADLGAGRLGYAGFGESDDRGARFRMLERKIAEQG